MCYKNNYKTGCVKKMEKPIALDGSFALNICVEIMEHLYVLIHFPIFIRANTFFYNNAYLEPIH